MTSDKITKIIFLIVLSAAFVIIQLYIKNKIVAISLLSVLLIVILGYLKFSGTSTKKRKNRIIRQGKRVRAKILAVRTFKRNSIILSLLVEHPEKFYITSYIITNPNEVEKGIYEADQQINIYVNPNNQYEVIIPETKKQATTPKNNSAWFAIFFVGIIIVSVGIPFCSDIFGHGDREFKDIAVIQTGINQENIWEISFKSPKKLYFKIYNPITKETVKSFKDKKEKELDRYTNFYIGQQGNKVFIVGTGNTPVIDVYDATTFTKISDITKFEESDKILRNGIASIEQENVYNSLTKDQIFEITTNDGNKCYYNIPQNQFYFSDKDMKEYFEDADFNKLSQQMFAFTLSYIPNSVEKHQLYIVETNSKKSIETLKRFVSNNSLDVKEFNKDKKYYYKNCNLIPLCPDKYFLKGKFIYMDASFAIIQHVTAINENADEEISGIDKNGKILFTINQSDYPNIKDMTEYNHVPNYDQKLNTVRINNKIIFLFGKHGALCIDINTGKILWKYEP